MNRKITDEDKLFIKAMYDMWFDKKFIKTAIRLNGHTVKKVDFYQYMARFYEVHWKTIERISTKCY